MAKSSTEVLDIFDCLFRGTLDMSFVVGDPADDDAIRFDIVLITVF